MGPDKHREARALIEARDAQLLYLPAQSTDFSPIALISSKLKTVRGRMAAMALAAVMAAICDAMEQITPGEFQHYSSRHGYHPRGQSL